MPVPPARIRLLQLSRPERQGSRHAVPGRELCPADDQLPWPLCLCCARLASQHSLDSFSVCLLINQTQVSSQLTVGKALVE